MKLKRWPQKKLQTRLFLRSPGCLGAPLPLQRCPGRSHPSLRPTKCPGGCLFTRRSPRWCSGEESACSVGDTGSIPGSGRSPAGGHGNPLQCSGLENPMDRGAGWDTVPGVAKSQPGLSTGKSRRDTSINDPAKMSLSTPGLCIQRLTATFSGALKSFISGLSL